MPACRCLHTFRTAADGLLATFAGRLAVAGRFSAKIAQQLLKMSAASETEVLRAASGSSGGLPVAVDDRRYGELVLQLDGASPELKIHRICFIQTDHCSALT